MKRTAQTTRRPPFFDQISMDEKMFGKLAFVRGHRVLIGLDHLLKDETHTNFEF
jgi:hypothetical protein